MTDLPDTPVAIVTGGGTGIGRATAEALAADGYRCILVGRREDVLSSTAAGLTTPGGHLVADVTDADARARVVDETLAHHGRLDVLVHAAGIFEKREVPDATDEFFAGVLDLNLSSVMALTREAWPALVTSRGQIVLISSIAAVQAFPGNTAYAASKGGMNAMGEVLALEGKAAGIRVITVCPGQTRTDLWEGKAPDAVLDRMMDATGVGRLVANLVAADRGMDMEPVVIRPMLDPWAVEDR